MASFNGKSYIERHPMNASLNFIDIVFYSMRVDGKYSSLKIGIEILFLLAIYILGIFLYNGDQDTNQFIGIKLQNSYIHFMIYLADKYESLM